MRRFASLLFSLGELRSQALLALFALAAAPVLAQAPASLPPPAEVFFKPARLHNVQLSPSGKRMALSMPGQNGRVGLFVIDLQGGDLNGTRAALLSGTDVDDFWWVDDDLLLFDITDAQAGLGDASSPAPGLYSVRWDGKDLRQLVETRGRPFISSGEPIRTLPWNHTLLHVPAPSEEAGGARSNEVLIGEMDFEDEELKRITPMWINTRTTITRSLDIERTPCDARHWWFSAPGEPRAVFCRAKGRDSLHWYTPARDGAPGRWRQLAEAPIHQLAIWPLWVGQGDTLYVSHPSGAAGEEVVARFDFAKGVPEVPLVSVPGFDFDGSVLGDPQGRRVLGARVNADAEQTVWFDEAFKAAQQRADAALPGRVNQVQCRRCGASDAVMLVRSYSDQDPGRQLADEGRREEARVLMTQLR